MIDEMLNVIIIIKIIVFLIQLMLLLVKDFRKNCLTKKTFS